jgi:tRNA A-37 threonylcarbamoyl transferase component Bud32
LNDAETDTDCGGTGGCPACLPDQICLVDSDCNYNRCTFGTCALFPTQAPTKNPIPNTKEEQQSYNEGSSGSEPTAVDVAAPAAAASGLGVVFEIGLGVCFLGLGLCLVVKTLKGRKAEQLLKEDGPIDAQQQGQLFNGAPTNPTTNPLNPLNTPDVQDIIAAELKAHGAELKKAHAAELKATKEAQDSDAAAMLASAVKAKEEHDSALAAKEKAHAAELKATKEAQDSDAAAAAAAALASARQGLYRSGSHLQWQVPSSAIVDVRVLSRDGAFGDVHLVQCRRVNMAFKLIRTSGSEAAREEVRAALKEARALREAKHENVIGLEGICIDDPQRLGVLMEYAEQGTLRHVLEANPNMADKQKNVLICGILRGLANLHSHTPKPILHGDLKATNVLVMADGTPKLADFGLASGASSSLATGMSMSATHRGGGTHVYKAPELFAHLFVEVVDSDSDDSDDMVEAVDSDIDDGAVASVYTISCDLYSAGVVAWEIETGESP